MKIFETQKKTKKQRRLKYWSITQIAEPQMAGSMKERIEITIGCKRVILVNMEISVILGHEKTKIRNIIYYGKIDVFSVRTNIHIKNKMMGHLI